MAGKEQYLLVERNEEKLKVNLKVARAFIHSSFIDEG
jgi:hypothetical protein